MLSKLKSSTALSTAATTLLAGVLSVACQTTAPTNGDETAASSAGGDSEALKIGSLLPVTGDLSSIGQNMPDAVNLAIETVNACGGVNGQPVALVSEDSQTDPPAAASAMSKLVEIDNVAAVVGAFGSSVSMAALEVAVENDVMLVSPGSTSPEFTSRAEAGDFNGYWARTAPPDTYQARALAKLASDRGFERVSTIVINNDYGVGFEQEFVQAFQELGGEIVNEDSPVRYDPKATTFDSEASQAFGGEPDAVLGVLYGETGSLLLKSAYEQGLSEGVTVLLTDGVQSEEFTRSVGETPDGNSVISGALGTVPGADGQALEDFSNLWEGETGKEVTAFVPHTWDATALVLLAAEAADVNTGEGIKNEIRNVANAPGTEVTDLCEAMELVRNGEDIDYQGASGNVDIDENGDVVGGYDVWEVESDASIKVIDKVSPATK